MKKAGFFFLLLLLIKANDQSQIYELKKKFSLIIKRVSRPLIINKNLKSVYQTLKEIRN